MTADMFDEICMYYWMDVNNMNRWWICMNSNEWPVLYEMLQNRPIESLKNMVYAGLSEDFKVIAELIKWTSLYP